jgi:hypothetical protein
VARDSRDDLVRQASNTVVERLSWHTASRDQAGIARELAEGKDISEIYPLGDATLVDEFLFFLEKIGVTALLPALDPHRTQRATNVSFLSALLIYLLRVMLGLRFFWHIGPVLLHSFTLMRLIGFNARQIREGTTLRGLKPAPADQQTPEACDKPGPADPSRGRVRGPYCPESIAASIRAITAEALEALFNATLRILAAHRFFPKKVRALLDATEVESTERCEGRGKVTQEKAPELRARRRRVRKVLETVFGFKAWLVWDPHSRLPLAIRFATIEVADVDFAQQVVAQAIENLRGHAQIVSLAFDRGFLDGRFWWWVEQQGIIFYTPAKTSLTVYTDALSLASAPQPTIREKQRFEGAGKNRRAVTDRWEVVGLTGLTSAGFYGELGSGSHENRKDFVPNPINAVVVLDDPLRKNNPAADRLVVLTNGPVHSPAAAFGVYDGYDARSEIENGLFREAKQAWFLERPAQNTIGGFRAHVYLTFLIMALTTAFRAWMEAHDKSAWERKPTDPDVGIRKFREMVREENANHVILFDEDRYALFEAYEIAILLGRRVLKPRGVPETITQEDILRKYGAARE